MTLEEYKITHKGMLQALPKAPLLWRPDRGRLVLNEQVVPELRRLQYQDELNSYYYSCGCDESAAVFFAGVIMGSLWLASYWFEGITPSLTNIVSSLAFPVFGALIGKVLGKFLANQKLKQTVRRIEQTWQVPD